MRYSTLAAITCPIYGPVSDRAVIPSQALVNLSLIECYDPADPGPRSSDARHMSRYVRRHEFCQPNFTLYIKRSNSDKCNVYRFCVFSAERQIVKLSRFYRFISLHFKVSSKQNLLSTFLGDRRMRGRNEVKFNNKKKNKNKQTKQNESLQNQ